MEQRLTFRVKIWSAKGMNVSVAICGTGRMSLIFKDIKLHNPKMKVRAITFSGFVSNMRVFRNLTRASETVRVVRGI